VEDTNIQLLCTNETKVPKSVNGIPIEYDLSLEDFVVKYFSEQQPVCMKGACLWWPAVRKWHDFNYLQKIAGNRTVPVEIGSSYTTTKWTQRMMTLNRFIIDFIERKNSNGYMAQHPLFQQIPALEVDAPTLEYALIGEDSADISRLVWIGPGGTVSPLHTDPHDNVFAQVVGTKFVRLYPPSETERLYPYSHLLTNTSQVVSDLTTETVDDVKYPLFSSASFIEGHITSGDVLYIPKLWWHFVKATSNSVSVSHWLL